MQGEIPQVDGAGEEGERGRGHHVGLVIQANLVDGVDFEGVKERERSRIDFREPLNVWPEPAFEIEGSDLSIIGRKQSHGGGITCALGDYI